MKEWTPLGKNVFYIRSPITGVDDEPHVLACPTQWLHAVPGVDLAHRRIRALRGRHQLQAMQGKRRPTTELSGRALGISTWCAITV